MRRYDTIDRIDLGGEEDRATRRRAVATTFVLSTVAVFALGAVIHSRVGSVTEAPLLLPQQKGKSSHEHGEVALFPNGAPDNGDPPCGPEVAEKTLGRRPLLVYREVSSPTLKPFLARDAPEDAPTVVVFPGGGFKLLAIEGEGYDIARRLNARGVHAFVLKYRVRNPLLRPDGPPNLDTLQDAQRAVSFVRHNARTYGIDDAKIGVCGFSAGGTLAALLSANAKTRAYDALDDVDDASPRPDFAIMVYPGNLVDFKLMEPYSYLRINNASGAPPTFVAHAADDRVQPYFQSVIYFNHLVAVGAGTKAQLVIEGTGNHGFETNSVCSTVYPDSSYTTIPQICDWMDNAISWMKSTLVIMH
ncbi:hypothetical protein CTAYLR_006792 [Chrysophaeum taylorii]|uniref:BD-FAE-like domain-containing protein n=1 Tax=Chrysophaeum taylorii TaxID=2483200 RepID=A0AAD7U7J3_9STRA|nr:hypothetical protein CTAYLR_006792 [Chrysophaeum taylorii]